MSKIQMAHRLASIPPYLFAEIDRVKEQVRSRGMDIISLGIGDPDLPTPDFIIEALYAAAKDQQNHCYPSYVGKLAFRQAVADWYRTRFHVGLNPETEVLTLIGSKEGIAHFPLAFVDPGDLVLICTPNYPVYGVAVGFAGGEALYVPLREENGFLPDLDAIDETVWRRAKMIFVNYPNNPTSATADRVFYEKLVRLARQHNVIVVHDAAYSEVYFSPDKKPMSILEVDGAKDVAIEFHSLSKTYNMTGWRVGMAVGSPTLIHGLGKIKENVDSGTFGAVQEAGIAALAHGEPYADKIRAIYRQRRDTVLSALSKIGLVCPPPDATFYIWSRIPAGYESSTTFVMDLLQRTGVVVTPGNGFGAPGEGYFRISLTVDTERLEEAVSRIAGL